MTYLDSLKILDKYNLTESVIISLIVLVSGAKKGSMVEIKGLPMKAYLNTELEVVYSGGKRYAKLEEAIKTIALM